MAAPNKATLGMVIQTSGFRRFMYFNRFAVERDDGFVHIHLGNVNTANALVDSYSTVISELELAVLKKSTMDYLGQQGMLLDPPPVWQPPAARATELANHIVMARHGNVAETIFYSFSFWSALQQYGKAAAMRDAKQPAEDVGILADGMALLRSPLRAQQHLIRLLFPPNEPELPSE